MGNHQSIDKKSMQELRNEYIEKMAYLADRFPSITPYEFYREVFPVGSLQQPAKKGGGQKDGKYNAIANVQMVRKRDGGTYRKNYIVNDSLGNLDKWVGNEAFMAPCSFVGKNKGLDHLREIYAFVVDLDDVGMPQLIDTFYQAGNGVIPYPTLTVNSGTGLHLYYVFEEPIHYYPDRHKWLFQLKHELIRLCWNPYTSRLQEPGDEQYSGLVQPYRIPGTPTKLDKDENGRITTLSYPVVAFRTGKKVTVDGLLNSGPMNNLQGSADMIRDLMKCGRTPLEEAKKKWPDWYDRRIVHGEKPKKAGKDYRWYIKPALYQWWLRRIADEAKVGHRYFCIMCLAIYALKCDVPFDRLKKDAYGLMDKFDSLTVSDDNHFTRDDVEKALLAYKNPAYVTFPINSIVHLTALPIKKSKRNGRTLEQHAKYMNGMRRLRRDVMGEDEYANTKRPVGVKEKTMRKNGVDNKRNIRRYAATHPKAKQKEIAEACGVTRQTVAKYLKDWQPKSKTKQ